MEESSENAAVFQFCHSRRRNSSVLAPMTNGKPTTVAVGWRTIALRRLPAHERVPNFGTKWFTELDRVVAFIVRHLQLRWVFEVGNLHLITDSCQWTEYVVAKIKYVNSVSCFVFLSACANYVPPRSRWINWTRFEILLVDAIAIRVCVNHYFCDDIRECTMFAYCQNRPSANLRQYGKYIR